MCRGFDTFWRSDVTHAGSDHVGRNEVLIDEIFPKAQAGAIGFLTIGRKHTQFLDGARSWLYEDSALEECSRCGYDWATDFRVACDLIDSSPIRITGVLEDADGMAPQADGSWNATAYVWHLADLAMGWSERWIQIAQAPGSVLVGWDPDELAQARNYQELQKAPGIWSLRNATRDLIETTNAIGPNGTFAHGDWGEGTVSDAMIWLGHEFHHHELDIKDRVRVIG